MPDELPEKRPTAPDALIPHLGCLARRAEETGLNGARDLLRAVQEVLLGRHDGEEGGEKE